MRNGCIRFAVASSPESAFLMFLCVTHSDPLCKLCVCGGGGGGGVRIDGVFISMVDFIQGEGLMDPAGLL